MTGTLHILPTSDLPSLISAYKGLNCVKEIMPISFLENYKRWLEDPNSPQRVQYKVMVLDGDWKEDGLFLAFVSSST